MNSVKKTTKKNREKTFDRIFVCQDGSFLSENELFATAFKELKKEKRKNDPK